MPHAYETQMSVLVLEGHYELQSIYSYKMEKVITMAVKLFTRLNTQISLKRKAIL